MDQTLRSWDNKEFSGFWFLNNFLREEEPDDLARGRIVTALMEIYDRHLATSKSGLFVPRFYLLVQRENNNVVRINIEQPSTKSLIGWVNVEKSASRLYLQQPTLI